MEAVARPYMLATTPKSYLFYRRVASHEYFTPSGGLDDLPGLSELVKATLVGSNTSHPALPIGSRNLSGEPIRMEIFILFHHETLFFLHLIGSSLM